MSRVRVFWESAAPFWIGYSMPRFLVLAVDQNKASDRWFWESWLIGILAGCCVGLVSWFLAISVDQFRRGK